MLTVIVDGRELRVAKGTFLLEAARGAGVDIPSFCHLEALEPYGSCRLCLVEVGAGDRAKVVTSCDYPCLRDGESVATSSPKVIRYRRVVMELLLSRCPESGPVRDMAKRVGVTSTRFPTMLPARLSAEEGALANCVLCGLCVRACEEAIGASAIGFSDRGPSRRVATPFFTNSKACIGCGACAAVCPTGVIRVEDGPEGIRRLRFLNTEISLRRCGECGSFFAPGAQLDGLRGKLASADGDPRVLRQLPQEGVWQADGAMEGVGAMMILAIVSGEYGDRHVANIRARGPKDWTVQTWVPPRILPQVIDEPEDFLPASPAEVDLVLAFQEDARAAQLICDVARLCKAKAVICAIDREEWLPRGLAKQLAQWLSKAGIASAFPKPLCALDEKDANVRASPEIAAFVRHFGRPLFRFDCDPATRDITGAEVLRDAVCGCARFTAEKLIGLNADDAEQAGGLAHHHFPCLAGMDDDSDFGDTLMHVSGNIMKRSIVEALGPWRKVAYFTPEGGGGSP